MKNEIVKGKNVHSFYLYYRKQALKRTNREMNLFLENDRQIYIAVFDIPTKSKEPGFQTQTLALFFGLNIHIYFGKGMTLEGLEKYPNIMNAMQLLFIKSQQVLPKMKPVYDTEFFNSKYVRAYLKTKRGTYYRELKGEIKEEKILLALLDNVLREIEKGTFIETV